MLKNMSVARKAAASILLIVSLGMFIHPIPSTDKSSYLFSPVLFAIFTSTFFLSRLLERGKSAIVIVLVEALLFLGMGYISHLTVSKLLQVS